MLCSDTSAKYLLTALELHRVNIRVHAEYWVGNESFSTSEKVICISFVTLTRYDLIQALNINSPPTYSPDSLVEVKAVFVV